MIPVSQSLTFSLVAAALAVWLSVGVAWAVEHRLFVRPLKRWMRMKPLRRLLVALALAAAVAFAGTKPGGQDLGGGSDDDPAGEVPPPLGMTGAPSALGGGAPLSPDEPVPCRVGTNETFDFSAPTDATVAERWRLRGAAADHLRLSFADWAFPFGGASRTNLTVFSWGVIEFPDGGTLVPFGASLGLVPEANWRLLPLNSQAIEQSNNQTIEQSNISPSLFWWSFTPSNTLQLTWRNALLGRETNSPVSFQAELNPNGAYVFRYDLTRVSSAVAFTSRCQSSSFTPTRA